MARDVVIAMQPKPGPRPDPLEPSDLSRAPEPARPAPTSRQVIPELGIADSGDLADDPGLAPGLMTAQATAPAPPAPAPGSPESRSQEFVPVEGGKESVDASTLLVAAYIVMWAIALAFVALSWMRQRKLESRIGELESALGRREPPEPRSPER